MELSSTPREDGFYFPAEFEDHSACWLMYPERPDIYPYNAKLVQEAYKELIDEICKYEPVNLCALPERIGQLKEVFPSNVVLHPIEYDGNWLRDTGPTFLLNREGEIRGVDWEFNAWGGLNGGCYSPWTSDNEVAGKILEICGIDKYKSRLCLEGGAILSDGEGTLLTTEETLLNTNRNPNISKTQIETHLQEYLGVKKIIWIKRGIYLDEAGGHIDGICCFVKPGVVALNWTDDKLDPQYEISLEAWEILNATTDAKGRHLEIHKIHQPNPLYITEEESENIVKKKGTVARNAGDRLPATYINFYFANKAIILPVFGDAVYDAKAIEQFKTLCPDRKIVPIYSRDILLGGGNVHCMTQQQPKVKWQNLQR